MDREKILDILKSSDVKKLFQQKHIFTVSLFGSFARGDNNENSDIDILIKNDGKGIITIFDLLELKETLKEKLNYKNIDLIAPKRNDKKFLNTINHDLIKVF